MTPFQLAFTIASIAGLLSHCARAQDCDPTLPEPISEQCDDGNGCTEDSCVDGQCAGYDPLGPWGCCVTDQDCPATPSKCLVTVCEYAAGSDGRCHALPIYPCCVGDADCDDGHMETVDYCVDTGCVNLVPGPACEVASPETCGDADPCTTDHCDAVALACTHVPVPATTPGCECSGGPCPPVEPDAEEPVEEAEVLEETEPAQVEFTEAEPMEIAEPNGLADGVVEPDVELASIAEPMASAEESIPTNDASSSDRSGRGSAAEDSGCGCELGRTPFGVAAPGWLVLALLLLRIGRSTGATLAWPVPARSRGAAE